MTKDNNLVIEIKNISKSFGNVNAINNVSLKIYKNEILCLLGDNGAGKSTLIKILAGVFKPDNGKIFVHNKQKIFESSKDSINLGIRTVFQDLAIFPLMNIAENFFVGSEPEKKFGFINLLDIKKMHSVAQQGFQKIGLTDIDTTRAVSTLSGGQRQTLAIARAEHLGAKILILDEPTSALGVHQASVVLKIIVQAAEAGLGVILITHNVHHAYPVGHRFTVLNRGTSMGTFEKKDLPREKLISMMAGGEELDQLEIELQEMRKINE